MTLKVRGQTAEALGKELGLEASAVKVLGKILIDARKLDPKTPGDLDELYFWVYRSRRNLLKGAESKIADRIVDAIIEYQERGPGRQGKAVKPTGDSVALIPKVHAEFTFFPTQRFRDECGVEYEDVGLFLDTDEAVLLAEATVKAGPKRTTVKIPQGKIEVETALWDVRTGAKRSGLKKYQVREWSWIEAEYRED